MESDNEIDNEKTINGNTPLKAKSDRKNANKRGRFDGNRELNISNNSFEGDESEELSKEKEKNRDLQFQFGKMQKQISDLTGEVKKLTKIIEDLQTEKKQLFEMLNKKSPARNEKKQTRKKKSTSTQNNTLTQTPRENNIQTARNMNDDNKQDGNSTSTSSAQPQQTDTNSTQSSELADIEMSENGDIKTPLNASEQSDDHDSESNSSSEELSDYESDNENENKKTHTTKRSHKIPPIDVWTDKRAEIQQKIQAIVPPNSCLFGRINNAKFRVFPSDTSARLKIIDFFKEKNIEFNTYTPNEEKMINVLIKGLDHVDDVDVIKDALAAKGFEPLKIVKHTTGYMRKNQIKSNLWLIVLQPNTDTNELFKIKAIDSAIIKFDFLRKPKVIQCRRCQRFNHSASNCSLPYRCVKCTDKHEPGKCKSESKNKFKPKCVNCQGPHTANDAANCPAFKRTIELRASKQKEPTKKSDVKLKINKSSLRTSQTYAQQLNANPQPNKTNDRTNVNIDQFVVNQNKMFSEFMATMQKMQQQFITNYARKNVK